jgi:SAM-dependent methyltransferase
MDDLLSAIGAEWKDRYYNRLSFIGVKREQIDRHLPLLKKGGLKVLDVSCGTGVMTEILRYYGNDVTAMEQKNGIFQRVLVTQKIGHIEHDCSVIPYPFPDQSFDVVINIAAIDQYRAPWKPIVQEFMRLARKEVFIQPNRGQQLEDNRQGLNEAALPGWTLAVDEDTYRWNK